MMTAKADKLARLRPWHRRLSKSCEMWLLMTALSPAVASAQDSNNPSATHTASHPVYLGIDATLVRARLGQAPGQTQGALTAQSFHLGTSISDALRVELPLRVLVTKAQYDHAETQVGTGLMLDVFPARFSSAGTSSQQSGFFVGGGPLADYIHYPGVTQTQFGIAGRGGYEFALDDLHLRVAGLFEHRFKSDNILRTQRYGGSIGMSFPVLDDPSATHRSAVKPGHWYVQARAGINHQSQDDSPTTTTLWLPKPFFSLFYFPGTQRRAALGLRTHMEYYATSAYSNRYIQLTPRAEINLLPHSSSRTGLQLGAHAVFDHLDVNSSVSDLSGTYYSAGGDISVTLPLMPTMWKIGLGFDLDAAGGNPRRPSGTNLRLDIAVDRFITHTPTHK